MLKGSLILAAFLVFFLFLTPVSPQCWSAKKPECDRVHYAPGLDFANWGIDITTMEKKESYKVNNYKVMNLEEWENLDGSCTLCKYRFGLWNPTRRIQPAITDWKANISCQKEVQHYVTKSVISLAEEVPGFKVKNDWKKELDVDVKPSANGRWILAGSDSSLPSFIKNKSSQDTYIFHLHHVSCSYYKFGINKSKAVSEGFKSDVQDLPENYDSSSKLKYRDLIKSYGTHFLTELDLGVRVMVLTALPVCRMAMEGINVSEITHCLEIEVGQIIDIDNVNKNSELDKCITKSGEPTGRWLRKEQLKSIEGGASQRTYRNEILFISKGWLNLVDENPALLSYSLEPLHTLLGKRDPRRESLRQAVSEYVKEKAVWTNCSHSCPPGAQLSASDSCSCQCPNDNFTTSMCCPQQRGLAKLTVTIQHAKGLWGDYITRTDAYVNVFFQDKVLCTSTLWNNNNPEWNEKLDFGIFQLTEDSHVWVHVWDEDFGWDDDRLGKCVQTLNAGDSSTQVCPLSHGHLLYKYHLACVPHLGGHNCSDYIPLQSN